MRAELAEWRSDVEDGLAPYGHFIAMRDMEEGRQPFTGVELALAAIGVAAWAAAKYLTGFLQELGRRHASAPTDSPATEPLANNEPRSEIEHLLADMRQLTDDAVMNRASRDALEARWSGLLDRLPDHGPAPTLNVDELEEMLRRFGLSRRTAAKVAPKLIGAMKDRASTA